jgi:hypothetical protein
VKTILSILLLVVYTVFTAGVTVKLHDCGGEQSASVAVDNTDPCTGDTAPMDGMCCSTEFKTQKIDDAQSITSTAAVDPLPLAVMLPTIIVSPFTIQHSTFTIAVVAASPPPDDDLTIVNSVFRI